MNVKRIKRRVGVHFRKLRRKAKTRIRRAPKVFARIGRRGIRRLRRTIGFAGRLLRSGPKRLTRRWLKRKVRKLSGKKTVTLIRGGKLTKAFPTPMVQRGTGGRHDIVTGRSIIEWRTHPELGRGRVLSWMPGRILDVEFEQGGRPPSGVPVEEIRLLA